MDANLLHSDFGGEPLSSGVAVDVCVCTYRRPSLEATLRSLAAQTFAGSGRVRVIVADNDVTPSALPLATRVAAELRLDLLYIHAPARNISIARNACLDASSAPLLAFIDDDEEATPEWLHKLVRRVGETGADIVFGPVQASYGSDAPRWMRRADLHSIHPVDRGGRIETGYTCNALLRRDCLGAHRFDPALGRSGGEDTWLFFQLAVDGARMAFCPDGLTTEVVPAERARLSWLLRRSFRTGQSWARILRAKGGARLPLAAVAAAKAAYCAGVAASNALAPSARSRALVRGALHVGVVAKLFGKSDLVLY